MVAPLSLFPSGAAVCFPLFPSLFSFGITLWYFGSLRVFSSSLLISFLLSLFSPSSPSFHLALFIHPSLGEFLRVSSQFFRLSFSPHHLFSSLPPLSPYTSPTQVNEENLLSLLQPSSSSSSPFLSDPIVTHSFYFTSHRKTRKTDMESAFGGRETRQQKTSLFSSSNLNSSRHNKHTQTTQTRPNQQSESILPLCIISLFLSFFFLFLLSI